MVGLMQVDLSLALRNLGKHFARFIKLLSGLSQIPLSLLQTGFPGPGCLEEGPEGIEDAFHFAPLC